MLATMSSVEEVGIFSVAFRFASVVLFVNIAFGQAWSPYAIKIRTDSPDTYRAFYARVLLLLLFVMLIVGGGVALFSGELLGMIMPDKYAASAIPLTVLSFGIILQSTQQVTAIGISLEKKTYLFARSAWLAAVVNFILNFSLIPIYASQGAAWATLSSYLVLTMSYLYYTQKLHPLPIQWARLMLMLAVGGLVLLISIVGNSILFSWKMVIFKLLFFIFYAGTLWWVLPIRRLRFGK